MTTVRAQARPSLLSRVRVAGADIKLAHSVFALPFAVLGAMLARPAGSPVLVPLALVVACMVMARTWAMLVNRLVDRRFDAANPRTSGRAIPSGRLRARDAWMFAAASAIGFWIAAGGFWLTARNPWPALLAPLVLAWIALYSLTKRFTVLCHVFLGVALAASPIAAAIALRPGALADTPSIWLVAGMVVCWVAGFDIIYALQDIEFDRSAGLRSVPASLGRRGAAWVSRGLHAAALGLLIGAGLADPRLGVLFGGAIACVAGLLVLEHVVLHRSGDAGIPMAFFTLNGVVSLVVGAAGVVDVVV